MVPNGETQNNNNCFIILLEPILIPTLWNKITYYRRIKCNETECSDTGITYTTNNKINNLSHRSTGWNDEIMSFLEFKQIINIYKKISFTITINILEISLLNNEILYLFNSYLNKQLPKQQTFAWEINNKLLNKFKLSHFGQIFESELFSNKMWCISCINNNNNSISLYLRLCSLPKNINKIKIKYTFKCKQTKTIQNECDEFSLNNQNSGSQQQFININQLNNLNIINISVYIQIIDIYYKNENKNNNNNNNYNINKITKENNKYKLALNDLMINFEDKSPHFYRQTLKINKLKKLASKEYPNDEIIIEYYENKYDEEYFDEIIEYININKLRKLNNILINCNNKILKQKNVFEIFIINKNERNPFLIGQKGLKTNIFIPNGTVIGQYFGREFLENEFDDIYSGTKKFVDINEYALSITVEINIKHSRIPYFTNTQNMIDNDIDNKYIKQEFSIVIDGINFGSEIKAMLIYMNDCRKNINMTEKTKDDEKYQNIRLVTVYHNGWPKIFGIAIKDIKPNCELLTYYGKSHVGWEQDKIRYKSNKKYISNTIHQILNKHNITSL